MDEAVGGDSGGSGGSDNTKWWWALASVAQFGWGVSSYTRGYAGDSRLMPLKAFAVASFFVGGAASASIVVLQYNGIRKVEDVMEVGANIRAGLGLPPRVQDETTHNREKTYISASQRTHNDLSS